MRVKLAAASALTSCVCASQTASLSSQIVDTQWIRRYRSVWLPLLLLAGLAIRATGVFWGQAYSYFGQGDAIAAYSVAVDYGRGEPRAQYIGQPNYNERSKLPGPLWAMWCFLGLRAGGSILGVVWANILLNVALIYLVCLLAERTVGPEAGFWAALFAATAPWAIYYSVGVYNPDVMAFAGTALCLALWQTVRTEKSRCIAWVVALLFALPQVHMSGLMLVPAVILVLVLSPSRINLPWLLGGMVFGLALYFPYLRGEMANGWQNTHGMFSGKGGRSWDSLKTLILPPGFLVNWVPQWTRSLAEYREAARATFGSYTVLVALNLVSLVMAVLVILGALRTVLTKLRGLFRSPRRCFQTAPGIAFPTIMLCLPLAISLVSGKPFHTRYCLVLLGPLLVLAGLGAASWFHPATPNSGSNLHRVFLVSAVLTIATNLWLVAGLYHFQGDRIQTGDVFVPSWKQLESVYQAMKTKAGPERSVRVDDEDYLAGLPRGEGPARSANLIRRYVAVREKESVMISGESRPPMVFKLLKAGQNSDDHTAYEGHGIRLAAVP
jgi:hypothetical protein